MAKRPDTNCNLFSSDKELMFPSFLPNLNTWWCHSGCLSLLSVNKCCLPRCLVRTRRGHTGLKDLDGTELGFWPFDFGLSELCAPVCIMMPSWTRSGVSHTAGWRLGICAILYWIKYNWVTRWVPQERYESPGALDPPMCQLQHKPLEKVNSESRNWSWVLVTKATPKNKWKFKCLDLGVSSLF